MKTYKSSLKIALFISALIFAACTKEDTSESSSPNPQTVQNEGIDPSTGTPVQIEYKGQKINVVDMGDYYIWMGDIMLKKLDVAKDNENFRLKAAGIRNTWPYGKVNYRIESGLTNQSRITDAINMIERSIVGLQFTRNDTARHYIYIISSTSSIYSSSIGFRGEEQQIGLTTSATTGNVVHEFLHALGVFHEQSRVDRDNHIRVNYENIQPSKRFQYDTYVAQGFPLGFDNGTFDFNSIMLYSSDNSYNGKWSMVKLRGESFTGQRNNLSDGDIALLNLLYPEKSLGILLTGPKKAANNELVSLGFTSRYTRDVNTPFTYRWEYRTPTAAWRVFSVGETANLRMPLNQNLEVKLTVTSSNDVSASVSNTITNTSAS